MATLRLAQSQPSALPAPGELARGRRQNPCSLPTRRAPVHSSVSRWRGTPSMPFCRALPQPAARKNASKSRTNASRDESVQAAAQAQAATFYPQRDLGEPLHVSQTQSLTDTRGRKKVQNHSGGEDCKEKNRLVAVGESAQCHLLCQCRTVCISCGAGNFARPTTISQDRSLPFGEFPL